MIERTNKTIEEAWFIYAGENHKDWAKYLQTVTMAYRYSIPVVTKYSPYYLIFGRPCSLPTGCMYETSQSNVFARPSDYIRSLKKELQTNYELVRDTVNVEQERQKI